MNRVRLTLFDRWVIFTMIVYLMTDAIGGVARYYLWEVGFINLIYIPKIMALLTLLIALISLKINKLYFWTIYTLILFAGVGVFYVNDFLQIAFGLWVFVPLLFGIVAYRSFLHGIQKLEGWFLVLFFIVCGGVLLNAFINLPWVGFNYFLANVEIEGSRQISFMGIARLGGFSQAGYIAASYTILLAIFLMARKHSKILRCSIWFLAALVIFLTASKGIALVFLVLTGFFLCWRRFPDLIWPTLALFVTIFAVIMLPLSSLYYDYSIELAEPGYYYFFQSSVDRISDIWLTAFKMITEHGNIITGRGLGGIGRAQQLYEHPLYNCADNLFIYLYAVFGLMAFPILAIYGATTFQLNIRKNSLDRYFYMIVLSILIYGAVTNIIESTAFSIFVGLSLAHIFAKKHVSSRTRRFFISYNHAIFSFYNNIGNNKYGK